ncbi:MAG: hypothetical protein AVDCRST_MAG43-250 [uncultured Thermomicrobiales bacterium]|uniref:Uncharacterized protein n=1 Tax=uncultured Thermomicrobiales bacterium TaxID=1645740 RepID=A0A6J4U9M7_9BACT|nr:MAG: hypothetical protein AVDCRST_MAG43-250 [uncultured Thermomicrobiales bacterium]
MANDPGLVPVKVFLALSVLMLLTWRTALVLAARNTATARTSDVPGHCAPLPWMQL